MKNLRLAIVVTFVLLTSIFRAQAGVIDGYATDFSQTSQVGNTENLSPNIAGNSDLNDTYIKYYIPLSSYNDTDAPYTYGVDDFDYSTRRRTDNNDNDAGLNSDSGNVYYNQNNAKALLNMFIHFSIPEGEVGESIKITFKDLDLEPTNDPNYFNERLFLGGISFDQGQIAEQSFDSWNELDDSDPNGLEYQVSYIDGSPVEHDMSKCGHGHGYNNDYMALTISGLNVTSGSYWLRLGFQAYSDYNGKLRNTAEYLKAEMHTAVVAINVNEPTPILLIMLFLALITRFNQTRNRKI